MNKLFAAVGAAIVLTTTGIGQAWHLNNNAAAAASSAVRQELKLQQPAPSFELKAMDNRTYAVGGLREKPLILNFWASWCGPCHEEAPVLNQIYEKYKDRVDLYAVNVTKGDGMSGVNGFVKQYKPSFPVLLDQEGKTAELYRILFVPTSFLIDREGKLREVVHVLPLEQWESKLDALLK
ncbi:TlpA disulfide reductase family protein [Paenibacillus filicis]|uniref:TlpA disulfide reductase family protein n=1 Tax=Paenibacillus gyeongsangnamensis TaxID=3388067 RepID=A0ABT4Q5D8_9BACL|nr:TlpA disulfide reductase family protein [Paenibacillus filicis]MCZ8512097.1 TlpA disulfide reductase family protein [Paenibacillus filicis]